MKVTYLSEMNWCYDSMNEISESSYRIDLGLIIPSSKSTLSTADYDTMKNYSNSFLSKFYLI